MEKKKRSGLADQLLGTGAMTSVSSGPTPAMTYYHHLLHHNTTATTPVTTLGFALTFVCPHSYPCTRAADERPVAASRRANPNFSQRPTVQRQPEHEARSRDSS